MSFIGIRLSYAPYVTVKRILHVYVRQLFSVTSKVLHIKYYFLSDNPYISSLLSLELLNYLLFW